MVVRAFKNTWRKSIRLRSDDEKQKKERIYARCLEKSFATLNKMLNVQEKEQDEWWEDYITIFMKCLELV